MRQHKLKRNLCVMNKPKALSFNRFDCCRRDFFPSCCCYYCCIGHCIQDHCCSCCCCYYWFVCIECGSVFKGCLVLVSGYICEMCHKYKIKFGGSTCSSQVISRTKQKQNLNNYKIKVYYSVRICTKELTMLLLSLLLPISPLV